jgi:hypothetical protein
MSNKKRATREELYDLVQTLEFLPGNWRKWRPWQRRLFCSEAAQRLISNKKRFDRISQESSDAFWKDIDEMCAAPAALKADATGPVAALRDLQQVEQSSVPSSVLSPQ